MRLPILAFLLSATVLSAATDPLARVGGTTRVSAEMTVRRVSPRALVFVHERPFAANSLVVEMADGTLVLCSTPYSEEATRALLEWTRTRLGRRRMIAVNTHFHADGTGGNPELLRQGIPVYGSDLTARCLRERGEASRRQGLEVLKDRPAERAMMAAIRFVPADNTFPASEGLHLAFGGERLDVIFPGAAHAPSAGRG